MNNLELEKLANEIRKSIVTAVHSAKSGHPGGSLSSADIFTYLYFEEMNIDPKNPKMEDRDRFVLSKGHVAPAYYSTLAERGFFPKEDLVTLRHTGSYLQGHPDMKHIPGVDMSSGSLGQGVSAVDFLSVREDVDTDKIGIIGICGWGGMALNATALDIRIKATVASTMYDMTRVNANGYFDSEDSEEARYAKKQSLNALRTQEYRKGEYSKGGGCVPLPVPEDAPLFVKDYSEYYKGRCYHKRSLNSNDGWNSIGCMSFMNQPILKYSNEIRSAVLIVHGEKAHSYYFGKDAYENMIKDSKYTSNKELLTIPGAVHTDLYDNLDVIPFDKIQKFFEENGVG